MRHIFCILGTQIKVLHDFFFIKNNCSNALLNNSLEIFYNYVSFFFTVFILFKSFHSFKLKKSNILTKSKDMIMGWISAVLNVHDKNFTLKALISLYL